MSFFQDGSVFRDVMTATECDGTPTPAVAKGGYALSHDAALRLVKIEIFGFWDRDLMIRYARDVTDEVGKVDDGSNQHLALCDMSRSMIQPQCVFAAFGDMLQNGPTHARRLAIVVDNLATRMQMKRLLAYRDAMAIFSTETEAMAWLTTEVTA